MAMVLAVGRFCFARVRISRAGFQSIAALVLLAGAAASAAGQDPSTEEARKIARAVNAAIESAGRELAFSAKFTLHSAWSQEVRVDLDSDFFLRQTDPKLDRAHGEMHIRPGAVKLTFVSDSPNSIAGGQQVGWVNEEIVEGNGFVLYRQHTPQLGPGQSIRRDLLQVFPLERSIINETREGMFFNPYIRTGWAGDGMLGRLLKLEHCEWEVARVRSDDDRDLLRISAVLNQPPDRRVVEWILDDSGDSPVLLEIRIAPDEHTRFSEFVTLASGVVFPQRAVTAQGGSAIGGAELCSVNEWRFTELVDAEPDREVFSVEISGETDVSGYTPPPGAQRLNLFELEPDSLSGRKVQPDRGAEIRQLDDAVTFPPERSGGAERLSSGWVGAGGGGIALLAIAWLVLRRMSART